MAEIFAYVEYAGEKLLRASQEAVSEAVRLAGTLNARCTALLPGHRIPPKVSQDLGRFGVDRVLVFDDGDLAEYSTERYTRVLAGILEETAPDILLMGGSPVARDLAPRVAARLGCGLVTEATFLNPHGGGRLQVTRTAFRPHASMILSFRESGPAVITMAPKVAEAERRAPKDGFALESAGRGSMPPLIAEMVNIERTVREIPSQVDLVDAEVIVAGGKGMQSGENFRLLEDLAEVLGGTVAASRMAVDLKWRPRECMVGVTGKVVSPGLYIACGISGAIQHMMGMQSSETVVAVNTDPNAPIFRTATLGILGDVRDVLPVMIDAFRKAAADADRGERTI